MNLINFMIYYDLFGVTLIPQIYKSMICQVEVVDVWLTPRYAIGDFPLMYF